MHNSSKPLPPSLSSSFSPHFSLIFLLLRNICWFTVERGLFHFGVGSRSTPRRLFSAISDFTLFIVLYSLQKMNSFLVSYYISHLTAFLVECNFQRASFLFAVDMSLLDGAPVGSTNHHVRKNPRDLLGIAHSGRCDHGTEAAPRRGR